MIRGTLLGVPIIRTIVFWGLYWGPLILGNYHLGLCALTHLHAAALAAAHVHKVEVRFQLHLPVGRRFLVVEPSRVHPSCKRTLPNGRISSSFLLYAIVSLFSPQTLYPKPELYQHDPPARLGSESLGGRSSTSILAHLT